MRMKNACAAGRVIMVLLAGAAGAVPVVSDLRLAQRTTRARVESSLPGKFTRNFYPAVQTAWTQPHAVAEPVGLTPASESSSALPSPLNTRTRLDKQGVPGLAIGLVGYSSAWSDTALFSTKRLSGSQLRCL